MGRNVAGEPEGDVAGGLADALAWTVADDPKVSTAAAVRRNQIESVLKPLVEFRDRSLLTSSAADVQALTVAEGKKETVSLKKDADSRWVFVKPEGYGLADQLGFTEIE